MNTPQVIGTFRWIVRDTFQQAKATRIHWIMLGFSALCIFFCLGVSVEGGDNVKTPDDGVVDPRTDQPLAGPSTDLGRLRLLFGAFRVPLARDRESAVHLLHVILASWVAGGIGLLVTLVWTAGFVPESLQPSRAAVLLTKPVPRWLVLASKYAGVVALVGFQAGVFFLGTWTALGLTTGMWLPEYLLGWPLLVVQFATFVGFSVFVGTATRSAIAAALGSVLFWALCMGVNYGRFAALSLPTLTAPSQPNAVAAGAGAAATTAVQTLTPPPTSLSPLTQFFIEASYWVFPKPADFVMILEQALNAKAHLATLGSLPEFAIAREQGHWQPIGSLLTSLLFGLAMVGCAGRHLEKMDY